MGHEFSTSFLRASKCELETADHRHETIHAFRRRSWAPKSPPDMLHELDVPVLLRRSYVRHGYRPLHRSLRYYVSSAFTWHNELVNFWTHFVPLIGLYLFYILPELSAERPRATVLFGYAGVSCLFLCSAVTHLMHSRSPLDHVFWLLVDFSGIALFSLSVGVTRFACRAENSPLFTSVRPLQSPSSLSSHPIVQIYVPGLASIILLQYLTTCGFFVIWPFWKTRHAIRILSCGAVAFWIYVPLYDRYLASAWEQLMAVAAGDGLTGNSTLVSFLLQFPASSADASLALHNRGFHFLLAAGFFMGANFPECCAPGRFDLVGYGHQLFHLCITCVTWCVCETVDIDCAQRLDGPPGLASDPMLRPLLWITFAALSTVLIAVTTFLSHARKKAVQY
ncbi:hypothetical protein M3Y99_01245500 [Aphelenchoides fujianensis]|nr:hypothetical protein M3Y99_01245500 [Aphelenchoides fujianensis]